MEGENPVLKDGVLSLQTSLNLPELPPRAPAPAKRRFDSQCKGGCSRGKFLLVWEVGSCYSVRLSRLIGGYGIVQPLTSYIRPKRNDTRVVPYKPYIQENFISKRISSL